MKHLTVMISFSIVTVLATMFFACSSTNTETAKEDEFFTPVDKIVSKESKPGSPRTITRDRSGSTARDTATQEILSMLQEQNEQLRSVVQEVNSLTKREFADSLKQIETLSGVPQLQDRASNEMLLEMIREQNLRLNDIVEQLKSLSLRQEKNQSRLPSRVAETPVEQLSASFLSPPWYDATLGYGKAIQLYQQRKYQSAIRSFRSLLANGVEAELQDNCHFWIGVCAFRLTHMQQAISEFTTVLDIVGSDKIEGAYFMLGQCYEQTGFKKHAKETFQKLVMKYPSGSLKQMAEIKLALLK
jgi:TolA-binding protein